MKFIENRLLGGCTMYPFLYHLSRFIQSPSNFEFILASSFSNANIRGVRNPADVPSHELTTHSSYFLPQTGNQSAQLSVTYYSWLNITSVIDYNRLNI